MKENILFGRGGDYASEFLNRILTASIFMFLYMIAYIKGLQAEDTIKTTGAFLFLLSFLYLYVAAAFNYVIKTKNLFKEINNIPDDETLTFKHAKLDIKNALSLIVPFIFIGFGIAAVIILNIPNVESYLKATS